MPLFEPNPEIFTNETVLRPNTYEPDEFPVRDAELAKYKRALQPVINAAPPKHIFLNGHPGSGKTAMTNYLLSHLKHSCAEYNIDLTTIYVSCENDINGMSSYDATIEIVNRLRDHPDGPNKNDLPTSGHSYTHVKNTLFDDLNHIGGTIIIVLDELHELTDDKILKHIPRAPGTHLDDDTHVGLIGISNDPAFLNGLSRDTEDSLTGELIPFDTYNATQLQTILETRAENAFHDDVLDQDVIPLCASIAAQHSGSARKAINLLREAGELARDQSADTVSIEHVRAAEQKLKRDSAKNALQALTVNQQLALLSVVYESIGTTEETPRANCSTPTKPFVTSLTIPQPRTTHSAVASTISKSNG